MTYNNSYNTLWDTVIGSEIARYCHELSNISVLENAKDVIFGNYLYFRNYCKHTYMKKADSLIDRHKVCACMILGIIKSEVLYDNKDYDGVNKFCTINEQLAITCGLSLLRAFIIADINESNIDESEKDRLIKTFENGIAYPNTNHGSYLENFIVELYYTKSEKNYNILSLSNTLYLLERFTRIQ